MPNKYLKCTFNILSKIFFSYILLTYYLTTVFLVLNTIIQAAKKIRYPSPPFIFFTAFNFTAKYPANMSGLGN